VRDSGESESQQARSLGTAGELAEAALERMRQGVAFLDGTLRVFWANSAFYRIVGELEPGSDEPLGPGARGPWSNARVVDLLTGTATRGTDFDQLECVWTAGGEGSRRVSLTARRLSASPETRVLLCIEDVTARAERDERMRQRHNLQSLGALAAEVAHDFNNLLVGILGNARLTVTSLDPDAPARKSLRRIERSARRAAELADQLLMFSGRGGSTRETVDLRELVAAAVDDVRASLDIRAALRFDLALDLAEVQSDRLQLGKILRHLLANAAEAIEDRGGVVTIRSGTLHADRAYLAATYVDDELPEGEYACLEVENQDVWMEADTVRRACDPFFTTKLAGRGLGLSAVLGGVRSLGGALRGSSEAGRGTTFQVLLPRIVAGPSVPVRERPSPTRPCPGGSWILLIEEEPEVLELGRAVLEGAGFRVLATDDPREGIALFRAQPAQIDAVILDLTMRPLGGEEVLAELRSIRPGLPVLLSTGYGSRSCEGFAGVEPAALIRKPYTPEDFLEAVRALL
jgi:signal transduction histidine kinase/CheY-like chemotaxis protein